MGRKTKELSLINAYRGRIIEVMHRLVRFDSGEEIEYELVHRPSVVLVIPVLPAGEIVLIRQYRAALDDEIWEFPGGTVNEDEEETLIHAAGRELAEETGYTADEMELLVEFHTSPHFSDEKVYTFIAKKLTTGQANLEQKEFITAHIFTRVELESMYRRGDISDAKTLLALQAFLHPT